MVFLEWLIIVRVVVGVDIFCFKNYILSTVKIHYPRK